MEGKVNTDKVFQGERLKEAREARGYTIRELTEKIELNNHQTLSKYENGKAIPPAEVLYKIMNILDFPFSYFFEKENYDDINNIVFFRSKASTTAKLKKMHEIKIEWVIRIFNYLENIVDFPKSDLPQIEAKEPSFFKPRDFEEIEEIALNMRKEWNLSNGPITDLTHLFEKHGIVVSTIDSNDYYVDACSKWVGNRLFILVGNEKASPSKIKFTLAHELGHYLLHHNITKEEFNTKNIYKRMEEEANHFASAFLLPAEVFSTELVTNTMDYYLLLKRRWHVSIQAMIYRSKELNLINEYQASYLWKQISKKGWRTKEPYDDVLLKEKPILLKEAIELINTHNVKTKVELRDEVKLSANDIEAIATLPQGYFSQYTGKDNVIFFKKNYST